MSIRPPPKKSIAGASLMELLVGMSIGLLVALTIGALSLYSGRSFVTMCHYLEMESDSRNALDLMTRDIRQTVYLSDFVTNKLTFIDHDGLPLVYAYLPAKKTLVRTKDKGDPQVLLKGCESLEFSIFQRNPVGGTYDYYPTANPGTAKLIQVRWTCARQIYGVDAATESVHMAKIVMRKRKLNP